MTVARSLSEANDAAGLRKLVQQVQGCTLSPFVRNRIVAYCVECGIVDVAETLVKQLSGDEAQDIVAYNTIIRGYALAGRLDDCFSTAGTMRSRGFQLSEVSYGVLLDACVRARDIDRGVQVFKELLKSGHPANTVHCTMLIKGFILEDRLESAMGIFEEMNKSESSKPDHVTYMTLVRAFCDSGDITKAIDIVERMLEQGLKAHTMSGQCDLAFSVLKNSNHPLEVRHFVQLVQACIRSRQGDKAIQVYMSLVQRLKQCGEIVDEATNSLLVDRCAWFRMMSTATQLTQAIAASGGTINQKTA